MLTAEGNKEVYEQIAGPLAMTGGAVKVAVHRMRQRYGELLREEIAHTVSTPGDIEEELHYLREVLAS